MSLLHKVPSAAAQLDHPCRCAAGRYRHHFPEQLGVTLYKLSLVSIAAILGYHLDRALFPMPAREYLIDDWKKKTPASKFGAGEPQWT
jgi:hypothetical protein